MDHYSELIDKSTACESLVVSDLVDDNQKFRSTAFIKK